MTNMRIGRVILHIPHSSTKIPYRDGYRVDESLLADEQLLLTDWYTDDLFQCPDAISVIADFSRIFCDVERFENDAEEMMSEVGMGVLYESRDDGSPLREVTLDLRARIISDYYRPHHRKLTEAVDSQLQQFGQALIIDCHSFPDKPLRRDLNQDPDRPDYNIGTDGFHTSGKLLQAAKAFFSERNLTVGINSPYAGSIVPAKYYHRDKRVQTIMLEINRRLYLEAHSSTKTGNYSGVKETIGEFIDRLTISNMRICE